MSPDRWKQVNELFEAALGREPQVRAAFLAAACAEDHALRREVESLLAAHNEAGDFIEGPAFRLAEEPDGPDRLVAGRRLGPYELLGLLGEGGMGRVYRARDSRLGRDVAVKVLSRSFGTDREQLARFQNEARAVSALNHPNVVTVHDVGEAEGVPFFAMELVEGRTLRGFLEAGRLPLKRALQIAAQVAEGLAAAHARGIVHRDLKPENVMVTREGLAKILDFGLAKQLAPLPDSEKEATLATRPGMVLGTVGYMSPEQAAGRPADFRSDHFSFGSILYETVTGRRAFHRPTAVETLAAILREEPEPLSAVDPPPLALRWILERCLSKDPVERYGATQDLARDVAQLRDSLSLLSTGGHPAQSGPGVRGWLARAAGIAVAAFAAGAALVALATRPRPAEPPLLRHLTYSGSDGSPAVSQDGRTLAFMSARDGRPRIWLKQINTGAEVALTEGPDDHPRFSADGTSVLFVRSEGGRPSLYRVSVLGGAPRRLLSDARAGDWSPDGRRLAFVRAQRSSNDRPTYLVGVAAADGSTPRIVESIEATSVTPPRWSPDSSRVAVAQGYGAALVWSILVLDPDGEERRTLEPPLRFGNMSVPVWAAGGREIVYAQSDSVQGSPSGRLVLQDVGSGRVRSLFRSLFLGGGGVDLAGPGRMVFTLQPVKGHLREIPLRTGAGEARWLTHGNSDDRQACYSPDGERVVFSSDRDGQLDLWEVSTNTGAVRRLTDSPAEDWDPRLTRDGKLLWSSKRSGSFEIWMAEGDGSAPRQVSRDGVDAENPAATPDGAWIVYASGNPAHRGIWKIRPDGSDAARLASGNIGLPEVSPDGQLVLYGSFTPPTTTLKVVRLADGSAVPFEIRLPSALRADSYFIRGRARWTPDGKAIAFVDADAADHTGIVVQDFVPGKDTSHTRRPVAGFDPDAITESFGFSPDGSRVALTLKQRSSDIVLAEGLEGVGR